MRLEFILKFFEIMFFFFGGGGVFLLSQPYTKELCASNAFSEQSDEGHEITVTIPSRLPEKQRLRMLVPRIEATDP